MVLQDTTRYNEVPFVTLRDIPEVNSEPCETSKIEHLRK